MVAERGRFPRSVYGAGDEPDARFSLANERTFLAWVRTSLALLAAGIALEAFDVAVLPVLRVTASAVLIGLGTLLPLQAWSGWCRTERALRAGRPLPAPGLAVVLAAGVLLAGVLLLVGSMVG